MDIKIQNNYKNREETLTIQNVNGTAKLIDQNGKSMGKRIRAKHLQNNEFFNMMLESIAIQYDRKELSPEEATEIKKAILNIVK